MADLVLLTPAQLDSPEAPPLSEFAWRFLAEGDSWFSIGALNPFDSANLLQEMAFSQRCVAVPPCPSSTRSVTGCRPV